jgi:hypothetical protein
MTGSLRGLAEKIPETFRKSPIRGSHLPWKWKSPWKTPLL